MKNFGILLVCLLVVSGAGAQGKDSTYSFTLKQAVDYAMNNQASVQNAIVDEQIALARKREITGIGLPQISASGDVKDFIQLPTTLIPGEFFGGRPGTFIGLKFGTNYNATGEVDISQLVFDGTFIVALQASKSFLEITQKATTRTRIEAASAVTKAYYTVLITEDRLKLIEANLARLDKLQKDTKALFDNGFVEKIDIDRIHVAYNNVMTERDNTLRFATISNNLLKFQLGMDQKAKLMLTDNLSDISFTADALTNDKFDPSRRIEYSILQSQQKLNMLDLRRNRMSYLPSLGVYGTLQEVAMRQQLDLFDGSKSWYPTELVGVHLTVPIFDGGQKHFRVEQSRLNILKTQNQMKSVQQGLDLEFSSSRSTLLNAMNTLEVQKKNMDLAGDIYQVTKKKYEQGVGSNLEVLTAETALKEAQTNYYGALYDALNAKVDFEKANGSLMK
ncbi:MAG: TolC family protein [Bacteroidia bacterium]